MTSPGLLAFIQRSDQSATCDDSESLDWDGAAETTSLTSQYRFVGVLGTGAVGIVVLAAARQLEATATAGGDNDLLFAGDSAPFAAHVSAARREYSMRNAGGGNAETLERAPLYAAIKRTTVSTARAAAVSNDTKMTLSQAQALAAHLHRDANSVPERPARQLSAERTEAAFLVRLTIEACGAVAIRSVHARSVELPLTTSNEIAALSKLKHPNIVRLFDVFYGAGVGVASLYLITEYVSNGDLAAAIGKHQIPKDAARRELYARRTVAAICSALAYMHDSAVTHRDLKPGNVLVGPPVKLCDFGLSSDGAAMRSKLGTAEYMAPEMVLADGTQPYSAKIDCWSLGVLAYELVSKEHHKPFGGRNESMVMQSILRHRSTVPPFLLLLAQPHYAVSAECSAFISALVCDVERRSSAAEALQHPWLALPESTLSQDSHTATASRSQSPDSDLDLCDAHPPADRRGSLGSVWSGGSGGGSGPLQRGASFNGSIRAAGSPSASTSPSSSLIVPVGRRGSLRRIQEEQ